MAWTMPRTWVTGELVTASIGNTHWRDNLLATLPAIVTTAGDMGYATGANTLARLAIGTANQVLQTNSGATAPQWTSTLLLGAGSVSAPTYSKIGDSDTGAYFPAADQWAVAAGGKVGLFVRASTGLNSHADDKDVAVNTTSDIGSFVGPKFTLFTNATGTNALPVFSAVIKGTAGQTSAFLGGLAMSSLNGGSSIVGTAQVYAQLDGATNKTKLYFDSGNGGSISQMLWTSGGQLLLNTATTNTKMTTGLTVQQGGADDEAVALKSSDVAHGVTALTETDTYGQFQKYVGNDGGLTIKGYTEVSVALWLADIETTDITTHSNAGYGAIRLSGFKKNGVGTTDMGAGANIVTIDNNGTTRFIFDADGTSWEDVGTAWTNFDDHDDVALLDSLSVHASRPDDPIHEQFRDWVDSVGREKLQALGLIDFNEDGSRFGNRSRIQMLLVGAVRQQRARLAEMATELEKLRNHPALAEA